MFGSGKYPGPPQPRVLSCGNPCFLMLRVLCNMLVQRPGDSDTTVEIFFIAVASEGGGCFSMQIVTSPTSPKARPDAGLARASAPPPPGPPSLWIWLPRGWGLLGVWIYHPPCGTLSYSNHPCALWVRCNYQKLRLPPWLRP